MKTFFAILLCSALLAVAVGHDGVNGRVKADLAKLQRDLQTDSSSTTSGDCGDHKDCSACLASKKCHWCNGDKTCRTRDLKHRGGCMGSWSIDKCAAQEVKRAERVYRTGNPIEKAKARVLSGLRKVYNVAALEEIADTLEDAGK
eukprot:TRINITY_DN17_c1_g1_i3.p2 TRINITY_DN17_c1_g1~~TRINITY_DN17_c1_g1_i3.p2  ORF type:complete len:145 (+),score=43.35 TRINITY_DN17_c1_g1_i3:94-528(+)